MTNRIAFQSAGSVPPRAGRPVDNTRYNEGPVQDEGSPFMNFWKLLNDLMRSREQPELLYGEAKDWWAQLRQPWI